MAEKQRPRLTTRVLSSSIIRETLSLSLSPAGEWLPHHHIQVRSRRIATRCNGVHNNLNQPEWHSETRKSKHSTLGCQQHPKPDCRREDPLTHSHGSPPWVSATKAAHMPLALFTDPSSVVRLLDSARTPVTSLLFAQKPRWFRMKYEFHAWGASRQQPASGRSGPLLSDWKTFATWIRPFSATSP